MPAEGQRGYDTRQPGLSEGLAALAETLTVAEDEGVVIHEVPGLGYKLSELPEVPGHYLDLQTDTIGSKGIEHSRAGSYEAAVRDGIAMSLNDALLVKSRTRVLIDTMAFPNDDPEPKVAMAKHLAAACTELGLPVQAGEQAVLTHREDIDFSVTTVGFVPKPDAGRPVGEYLYHLNRFREDDVLIGIRSNGIHANGLTDARNILERAGAYERWLSDLARPTRIYYPEVSRLYDRIGGMMHLSGDAYAKLAKVLPPHLDVTLSDLPEPQPIFRELQRLGEVTDEEMYRRFNNGTGFVVSVRPEDGDEVLSALGPDAAVVGSVGTGTGRVRLRSAYSGRPVVFEPSV